MLGKRHRNILLLGADDAGRAANPDLNESESEGAFDTLEEAEVPAVGSGVPTGHVSDSIQPDLVNLAPSDLYVL